MKSFSKTKFGVLAGLALVATLVAGVGLMYRVRADGPRFEGPVDWVALGVAGIGGLGCAALLSSSEPPLYAVLIIIWAIAAAIFAVTQSGWEIQSSVIACAIVGLAIHLLGAGGIGMPGVAQSLWVLLALGLNVAERARSPRSARSKSLARAAVLASAGVVVCFALLVLRPVTASQSAIQSGQRRLLDRDLAGAETQFQAAAKFDPLSAEPWIELTRIHYERWRPERGRVAEEQFGHAVRSVEMATGLAPSSLEPYSLMGGLFEARAARDAPFWPRAIQAYRRCVQIYPTSATLHARLANSLWQSGEHDAARVEMSRALQLDNLTPHLDKKLAKQERDWIETRLGGE